MVGKTDQVQMELSEFLNPAMSDVIPPSGFSVTGISKLYLT